MQYYMTPSGRQVGYDNMAVYSQDHIQLFKSTPEFIDSLISRGSISTSLPIVSTSR